MENRRRRPHLSAERSAVEMESLADGGSSKRSLFDDVRDLEIGFSSMMDDIEEVRRIRARKDR